MSAPQEGQGDEQSQGQAEASSTTSQQLTTYVKPDPVHRVETSRVTARYQKLDYVYEQMENDTPKFMWTEVKDGEDNLKGYRAVFTVSRSDPSAKSLRHESQLVPAQVKDKFEQPKEKLNPGEHYTVKLKKVKKDSSLNLKEYF